MNRKNKNKNKQSKGRGRPKKVSRLSINSGRKKTKLENASRTTLRNRAENLLNDPNYNAAVISIANKRINSKSQEHEIDHLPKRHTPSSALAFFITNDYTKSQYEAIISDTKGLGYNIYPSYPTILEEKKVSST